MIIAGRFSSPVGLESCKRKMKDGGKKSARKAEWRFFWTTRKLCWYLLPRLTHMKRSFFVITVMVLSGALMLLFSGAAGFPQIEDWSSLVIVLDRSGCFGTCTSYRIEVH